MLYVATSNGKVQHLSGKSAHLCTSLYVDDAVIFLAPFKEDVATLAQILINLGMSPVL
jgi:hypothetical protein